MRRTLLALTLLLLGCSTASARSVKVLIITGDHGHKWRETTPVLQEFLTAAGHEVEVTSRPRRDLTADNLLKFEALLFNYRDTPRGAKANPDSVWTEDNKKAFVEAVRRGVGLVIYHHASAAFRGDSGFEKEFEKLSAGGWRKQGFHGKMHVFTVTPRREHAITRGLGEFDQGRDELYQNSLITPGSQILATAYSDKSKDPKNTGKDEPMVWVNHYGDGRVVQNALGHDFLAMQSEGFQTLMTRCVEWAATGETFCAVPESLKIPLLEHVDVFTSGQEGYHTFRIPGVETALDGSVIAFAEARKYNRGDPGHEDNDIDMVMKRSTDGGRTWSALEVLDDPGERWAASNPVLLRDRITDRVWAFYCRMKRGRGSVTSRVGTDDATTWVRYSEDQGVTWSEPTNITQAARDPRWGSVFYGPGGGIQTRQGRLVLTLHGHEPPARTASNNSLATKVADWPLASYAIYSDDHGKSWKRGEVIAGVSESQLVELVDGRLLIDARQNEGPRRFLATSEDGGGTWSTPTLGVAVTRVACAVERVTLQSTGDDRDRIVWTGPKGPGRARLVVRTSYDEGKTFTNERLISDDKAAYSDLTTLKDRSVGVLWERGDYGFITFSRFSMKFLEPDGAPAAK